MSADANKQFVCRYYEKVVSAGAVDRLPEFISPGYVEVHNNTRHPIGLDGAKEHLLGGAWILNRGKEERWTRR